MSVEAPVERAYYYECSAGKFRLTLFIPPGVLAEMVDRVDGDEERNQARMATEDFPDGIDLGCTKADFDDFTRSYRIPLNADPDRLRDAFFAMFSTTRDWDSFRGTGFVRAEDLEKMSLQIQQGRERANLTLEPPMDTPSTFNARRDWVQKKVKLETQVSDWLKNTEVEGVNPDMSIQQQPFSRVKMQGKSAEKVFLHLHRRRGGDES